MRVNGLTGAEYLSPMLQYKKSVLDLKPRLIGAWGARMFTLFAMIIAAFLIPSIIWRWNDNSMLSALVNVILFFVVFAIHSRKIPTSALLLGWASFLGASAIAAFWGDLRLLFVPGFLILSVFILVQIPAETFNRFIELSTGLFFVFLVGAWTGWTWAVLEFQPIFEFEEPREIWVFPFTLTPAYQGIFIRPSAIFDEPGAFSFFICCLAAVRHLLGFGRRKTWILLIGGIITNSGAQFIYILFYLFSDNVPKIIKMVIMSLVLLTMLGLMWPHYLMVFWDFFSQRFSLVDDVFVSESFVGRVDLFQNAAAALDDSVVNWLFGADSVCVFTPSDCSSMYGLLGENPLHPIVLYGLLGAWPYLASVLGLALIGCSRRRRLVALGIAVLLLQRPYTLNVGYAFWVAMVVLSAWGFWAMRSTADSTGFFGGRVLNVWPNRAGRIQSRMGRPG